jgi:uncharacterized protein YbjT (DUF2867 family)
MILAMTPAITTHAIFITGSTGLMGSHLIPALLAEGHSVRALARPASAKRLPPGCTPVLGDALDATAYAGDVRGCDTFIHLVGVSHPSPAKAAQFREIDLSSLRIALANAQAAGVAHFIYMSVAQPAPVMKAYIAVRREGEELLRRSGLNATFIRPWYVIGPGRRWPLLLKPVYAFMETFPSTQDSARRLGLVTIEQMVGALVHAVENPSRGIRILTVPDIHQFGGAVPKA